MGSVREQKMGLSGQKLAKEYKINLKCLVLDKGFYSQSNIKDLDDKGLSYIIPMSFVSNLSKELVKFLIFLTFRLRLQHLVSKEIPIGIVRKR